MVFCGALSRVYRNYKGEQETQLMVTNRLQQTTPPTHFVIRPNSSLTWRGNVLFFLFMVTLSFSIAGVFTALGAWMVFPFAGLEMAALGVALYVCATRATHCEVISICEDRVEVVIGRHKPEQSYTFNRHWARVILIPSRTRGHPNRLVLSTHGRELEIGACLNNEERVHLARALEQSVA